MRFRSMRVRRAILALAASAVTAAALAGPAPADRAYRYPLNGPHNYGNLAVTGFGVKRADGSVHTGQDIIAECGTPIVAARGGRVKVKQYEGRAGNYVVIDGAATSVDFAYMHLRDEALADEGDRVHTGQLIGFVGDTGRADGCHLHFELWTAGGRFTGGRVVNPRPALDRWEH
jgi:murein DD-endopeptidase MepM/ murein hydrolase activator NlpD